MWQNQILTQIRPLDEFKTFKCKIIFSTFSDLLHTVEAQKWSISRPLLPTCEGRSIILKKMWPFCQFLGGLWPLLVWFWSTNTHFKAISDSLVSIHAKRSMIRIFLGRYMKIIGQNDNIFSYNTKYSLEIDTI